MKLKPFLGLREEIEPRRKSSKVYYQMCPKLPNPLSKEKCPYIIL